MKKKMKCTGIVLLAIIMLSLSLRIQSRADEKTYTLTMTMHDALTSVNGEWYQNWADQIYEATDGHVEIKIFGSAQLCQGPDVVDYVLSRSADIGWIFTGFYSEQFPLAQVSSIPLTGINDSIQGTKALWYMYESSSELQSEVSAFKVLFLYNNPVNFISTTKKEITSAEDLKGLNLRCPTGAIFDYLSLTGANPIQMSSNEIYDNLNKNVIDGAVFEWSGIGTWSLYDSLNYYMDLPLFCGTFMTVINWDAWNELPEEYQAIIESVSLRDGSISIAQAFNDDASASKEAAMEKGGQLTSVSDEMREDLEASVSSIAESWCDSHSTDSFDANAYLESYREYLKKEAES